MHCPCKAPSISKVLEMGDEVQWDPGTLVFPAGALATSGQVQAGWEGLYARTRAKALVLGLISSPLG